MHRDQGQQEKQDGSDDEPYPLAAVGRWRPLWLRGAQGWALGRLNKFAKNL
jgi:hypothetical protein